MFIKRKRLQKIEREIGYMKDNVSRVLTIAICVHEKKRVEYCFGSLPQYWWKCEDCCAKLKPSTEKEYLEDSMLKNRQENARKQERLDKIEIDEVRSKNEKEIHKRAEKGVK